MSESRFDESPLFVFDREEKFCCLLSNSNPEACPYTEALYIEKLQGEQTFEFIVPANHEDAAYLVEENMVAFQDLENNYQLFIIRQIEEAHGEIIVKRVYCEHASLELLDEIVTELRPKNVSAGFALLQVLDQTRWLSGTVANLGLGSLDSYYDNALSTIHEIANIWGGELRFRVTISGNTITGRYVDLISLRGTETGKRFEYNKDIINICRKVDSSNVKTALIGRGKGEETGDGYGRRITFEKVEWQKAKGHPVDKPKGQNFIGDAEALVMFGRSNSNGTKRHRMGLYEDIEEDNPERLLEKTWMDLQKQKMPLVQYELTVVDLETLTGYDHEKVRLGDQVIVIDRELQPALTVKARIIEIRRYKNEPEKAEVRLGNFLPIFTDQMTEMNRWRSKVANKEVFWDNKMDKGNVKTDWLEGVINALQNEVRAGSGTVKITEQDGILITDKEENPTRALRLLGGILAIANSKNDATGEWNWRTFGSGDGFTADLINTGKIRSNQIEVGFDTTFQSGYDPSQKETPEGSQAKANSAEEAAKSYAQLVGQRINPYFEKEKSFWSAAYEGKTVNQTNAGTIVHGTGIAGGAVWEIQGQQWAYYVEPIPVNVNRIYKLRLRVRQTINPTNGGEKNKVYAGVVTLDGNYRHIDGGAGFHRYCAVAGTGITTSQGWHVFEGLITGVGNQHHQFRQGTVYVRPLFLVNYEGGNGTVQVDSLEFIDVTESTEAQQVANTVKSTVDTNKAIWDRAATINSDDTITASKLKGAINVASNMIQRDSNFYWDQSGFYAKDPNNVQRVVRITSGGVGVSTNGGQSFRNAITADGVVASTLTAGTIQGVTIEGGTIRSNTSIDVTTNLRVGKEITLGSMSDGTDKKIHFSTSALISTYPHAVMGVNALRISSPYLTIDSPISINGTLELLNQNGSFAWQTNSQYIGANTWTKLTYNHVGYDRRSEYNNSLSRFTASSSGRYLVTASIRYIWHAHNTTSSMMLYRNGGAYLRFNTAFSGAIGATTISGAVITELATGHYIELYGFLTNPANTDASQESSYFTVYKIA
ncbi:phage tail spike protein [Heliorestis convoluta]|uniref:Phage minor structural protein n=1 Tax=Heliorestis convoluta TaxID=356322 RepID=A0A5Q2MY70_9FIRM|nr:phage tail spike protein [Heliorestis convoluta]QGG47658.1 phage minor structural protein [Heliorestis convoluta]